ESFFNPRRSNHPEMKACIRGRVIHSPLPDFDVGDCHTSQMLEECLMKWSTKIIAEHGVKPGSRVCTHIRNTIENMAAALAVVIAGGTLVMAKTAYVPREVLYVLRNSQCDYILTDKETAPNLLQITMPLTIKVSPVDI
ncbi:unnamed protein product, partial [Ixodes persulcatus]